MPYPSELLPSQLIERARNLRPGEELVYWHGDLIAACDFPPPGRPEIELLAARSIRKMVGTLLALRDAGFVRFSQRFTPDGVEHVVVGVQAKAAVRAA